MLVDGCKRLGDELCSLVVEPFHLVKHTREHDFLHPLFFKNCTKTTGSYKTARQGSTFRLFKVFLVAHGSHTEMKDVAYSEFKYKGIGKFFFFFFSWPFVSPVVLLTITLFPHQYLF